VSDFWTNEELIERLVIAHERLAFAMESMRDELRRAGTRYWPQPREQREAVVTKVETDAERERKMQGAKRRTITDALDPNFDEEESDEIIGERTRQWLRDHPREQAKMGKPESGQ
jgi:hypothetical protein